MKVKVRWSKIEEALGVGHWNGDRIIEVEAEPIVDNFPNWINLLRHMRCRPAVGYECDVEKCESFIRTEILTKFAEECKTELATPYAVNERTIYQTIDAVLKRWMGGKS